MSKSFVGGSRGASSVVFEWPVSSPVDSPRSVLLAGSFTEWQGVAMERTAKGFAKSVPLGEGHYEYKFIVDGHWTCRPGEPTVADPRGNLNHRITVGSPTGSNQPLPAPQAPSPAPGAVAWAVEGEVDYDFLVKEFGTQLIDPPLLDRFERLTGRPAHPWLKRGLFFSHRSLHDLLDAVERGTPFYLYTGRGPSTDSLHLGHMVPFVFSQWLQEVFDVPIVIQLTDDEKFFFKDLSLADCQRLALENAKDIIACGFDVQKTFIFRDTDFIQPMYNNVAKILRCLTVNQVKNIFGLDLSANSGKFFYPAVQAAPAFSSSFPHIFGTDSNFPCLIPCGIDQDPFFRMTRDIAPRLNYSKPVIIHSKFFPALQGSATKMSSSVANAAVSTIFMTDDEEAVAHKVNCYAFSGGRATVREHRERGGDLEVDVPYQYLRVFEFDEERLRRVGEEFSCGRMLSKEIKRELVEVLVKFIKGHQERRRAVDDSLVAKFMERRPLLFKGNKII